MRLPTTSSRRESPQARHLLKTAVQSTISAQNTPEPADEVLQGQKSLLEVSRLRPILLIHCTHTQAADAHKTASMGSRKRVWAKNTMCNNDMQIISRISARPSGLWRWLNVPTSPSIRSGVQESTAIALYNGGSPGIQGHQK